MYPTAQRNARNPSESERALVYGALVHAAQLNHRSLDPATDAIPLPKSKPRAMREHFVVPPIQSFEVSRIQRPDVRGLEHFL